MRFRSIASLSVFGGAAVVALKYPLIGLGMCICCLIVYIKPEAPGAEGKGGLSPIVWKRDDMKAITRRATEADAKHAASLLTELGYPSTEADARDRLVRSLRSATSYCLVAEVAAEVVGLISAELVFYFPTGSTICRITSLVVSSQHRGHGLGQKLLTAAIDFAREHHCSGLELTSAEGRVDAHRFYRRLGFSRTSFRFFQTV